MTNAEWIFQRAIQLMDEASDRTGLIVESEVKDFRNRTLPILNIIGVECFLWSDRYISDRTEGRPVFIELVDFETPIELDDSMCKGILPYGLAAKLFVDENPDKANFFQQRYEEMLAAYKMLAPAYIEDIDVPHGGVEMGQFGSW